MTDYTDLKDRVMTFETLGGLWVCAEDYVELEAQVAALTAERDALREALDEALTIPYWGDAQDDLVRLSAITAPTT